MLLQVSLHSHNLLYVERYRKYACRITFIELSAINQKFVIKFILPLAKLLLSYESRLNAQFKKK